MDPRDHKGDEGVTEAAEDGMAGKQIFWSPTSCSELATCYLLH